MLEPPDLDHQFILARLRDEYGLPVTRLTFLPLGADVNTAVFRAAAGDPVTTHETAYFLKLRKGSFAEITVTVPAFLNAKGIRAVIAPLPTRTRHYWANLDDTYNMILYPFVEGQNGYEVALTDQQWLDFGAALKDVHAVSMPPALARHIPRESYSPQWREMVRGFQAQVEHSSYSDPTAAKVAELMRAQHGKIDQLIHRAGEFASTLMNRTAKQVLCHADLHAGNLLISPAGPLYIVDWDNPTLAPKEHDLALIGGSPVWNKPRETALFYQGYRADEIDHRAMAYYRCERILQDIAAYCQALLLSNAGGQDREQSLIHFSSQFQPGAEIELALNTAW